MDSKILVLLIATFLCVEAVTIQKRGLLEFYNVIKAVTGRNAFDFNGYGSYCGWGGSGNIKDSIDACCKVHDDCYGNVGDNECSHATVYTAKYNWTETNGKVTCENNGICLEHLCECDKNFAECIRDNMDDYDDDRQSLGGLVIRKLVNLLPASWRDVIG